MHARSCNLNKDLILKGSIMSCSTVYRRSDFTTSQWNHLSTGNHSRIIAVPKGARTAGGTVAVNSSANVLGSRYVIAITTTRIVISSTRDSDDSSFDNSTGRTPEVAIGTYTRAERGGHQIAHLRILVLRYGIVSGIVVCCDPRRVYFIIIFQGRQQASSLKLLD